jgi:hypothetical protein
MIALMPANCWNAKMRQLMTTDLVVSNRNRPGLGAPALPRALARPAGVVRGPVRSWQTNRPTHP